MALRISGHPPRTVRSMALDASAMSDSMCAKISVGYRIESFGVIVR